MAVSKPVFALLIFTLTLAGATNRRYKLETYSFTSAFGRCDGAASPNGTANISLSYRVGSAGDIKVGRLAYSLFITAAPDKPVFTGILNQSECVAPSGSDLIIARFSSSWQSVTAESSSSSSSTSYSLSGVNKLGSASNIVRVLRRMGVSARNKTAIDGITPFLLARMVRVRTVGQLVFGNYTEKWVHY